MEDFVSKMRQLLNKEREAEIEETRLVQENVSPKVLEHRGVCVLQLHIGSRSMGLYGRLIVTFEPKKEMPSHNLTPGDIVGLSLSQGDSFQKNISTGVISRVTPSAISVAFDDTQDLFDLDDSVLYRLIRLANDVTYRRLQKALDRLEDPSTTCCLKNVLFGLSEPTSPTNFQKDLSFINQNLDESQKDSVKFALHQPEVAIIHGPPGTGKTTTVTEIILQAVKSGLKVLACAPSNIAVDNLVERLAAAKVKLVRLGHPARLLPNILCHSLDAILASSDETKLVEDVRTDINKSLSNLRKVRNKGERHSIRQEIKVLRSELRQREEAAVKEIFKKAQVIMATLTMSSEDGPLGDINKNHFDLVVIDECSQALEVACWIALLRGKRCVLAGDHNQLPPTIISHEAAKNGLEVTLMERLVKSHKEKIVRMLTMQYRMHENIMAWSSHQLYDGRLTAHPSVSSHLLRDLPDVHDSDMTDMPLLLVDTAGCELNELQLADGVSKGNEGEADITAAHVEKLVSAGLVPSQIGVITPYNLQVELLRLRLAQKYPKLEIKSVDGFQGREKEAIILSLVRSNRTGEVGFLAEDRRINVAVTRARRHLAVICDTDTVGHHPFLKSLIDHITQHGEVKSAQEYIQEGALNVDIRRPDHIELQIQSSPTKPISMGEKKPRSNMLNAVQKSDARERNHERRQKVERQPKENLFRGSKEEAEAANIIRKEELRKKLQNFSDDNSASVFTFPASLTSYDRLLIHEIAEELGLLHLSKGEGNERCIEVRKPPEQTKFRSSMQEKTPMEEVFPSDPAQMLCDETTAETDGVVAQNGNASSLISCHQCGKEMPEQNLGLHSLKCKRPDKSTAAELPKREAKPRTTKTQRRIDNPAPPDEDFDSLIAAAMKQNRTCGMDKCKNGVSTLGQTCAFCQKTFCLSHHVPEIHGCGDKARQHARTVISKEGVLYRGSGVPSKKPDPARHAQLQRKLDRRIDELAAKRKSKTKEK